VDNYSTANRFESVFDYKAVKCKLGPDRKNGVGDEGVVGAAQHLTLLNIKYQGHYLQSSALID